MSQAAGSQPAVDQGVSLPRYLVVHGRDGLALYHDWPQAALRVQGFPNAIFKKYRTGEEARDAYNRAREVMTAHGATHITSAVIASLRPPPAYSSVATTLSPYAAPAVSSPPVADSVVSADTLAPVVSADSSTPVPAPATATGPAVPSALPASTHDDLIAALRPYDTLSDVGVSDVEDTDSLLAFETASTVSVPETEIDEAEVNEAIAAGTNGEQVVPGVARPETPASSAPAEEADELARIIRSIRYLALHTSRRPFPTVLPLLRAAVEASLTADFVPDPAVRLRYIEEQAKMLADVLFSGQAYYVIIRGREPGVTRTSWAGARKHVDGIADSYYQAFHTGAAARRWWKQHRAEVVDFGPLGVASPLDNHDPNGPVPTANN